MVCNFSAGAGDALRVSGNFDDLGDGDDLGSVGLRGDLGDLGLDGTDN